MDAKELNALVHDREAEFYDDRFLIDYDDRIARDVSRDLTRLLGERPHVARALDLACGTGYAAVGLARAGIADEVHACDLSFAMVQRTTENAAEAGARVHTALSDAERIPYADDAFDLVVARGALHHVPDPIATLREMRRVLRPGGTGIVLAEPTPQGERQVAAVVGVVYRVVSALGRITRRQVDGEKQSWEMASIAANLHTFSPDDIAGMAEKAGFEDIEVGTASWAWILVLGVNYYLQGEFERAARLPGVRRIARASADAAAAFDRLIADRVLPARSRHTIQAVLR